ncbi:hypothetical protein L1049_013754 [Liquidambar formosana]|uniref:Uncharacterized protein n=1 Tax=Liquidambar formosana TaxID=63359 RepID=A0AAP0RPD2_LIQFO
MSQQRDDERQYRCLKKYEEIVKQVLLLDELTESMEAKNGMQNRRKNTNGSGASTSSTTGQDQGNINQVFVQTITRFLHDLNPNANNAPDRKPSNP